MLVDVSERGLSETNPIMGVTWTRFLVLRPQRRICAMKGLLISAFATAVLVLGWSAVSTTPAKAYNPPHCIHYEGYYYCLSSDYYPDYCIYQDYNYHQYIYCRQQSGGGSSGY
jgi:hypothetical protein